MRIIFKIFIYFFILLNFSGCLLNVDGGYRANDLLNPNQTKGFLDYNKVVYRKGLTREDINKFVGEYKVVESWSNSLYKTSKIVLDNSNDKVTLFLYRNDWLNPSHKIEFSTCYRLSYIKNIKSGIVCYNESTRENSRFELFETTENTSILSDSENIFSRALAIKKEVKIKTKYGIKVQVWSDVAAPVFSLDKNIE